MSFYSRHILPRCIDWACGSSPVARQRAKVVPNARGTVLEIGIGSGRNLPFYDAAKVERVFGLEPVAEIRRMGEAVAADVGLPVTFLDAPAERVPLDDASVDTIVVTYTLCTIPDVAAALAEARRVLRPAGDILFCEHGRAPDESVRRWQDRLDPLWCRLAGGCHLNRPIDRLLLDAGLEIAALETMYLPGPRPLNFNYWGTARVG